MIGGGYVVKTYPSIDPVVAPPILLNVTFVFTSVAMTLRSQRSIYGHCLGHGSGTCMFKAARENCTISYEVNKCRKHMLLNDILQLVVLLDNYTTILQNIYCIMRMWNYYFMTLKLLSV